jgi:ABC-2 type transport system ATP-binding protein
MTGAADPAITVAGARQSFGETLVSRASTFSVEEGTVFALVGPNGSGKKRRSCRSCRP